MDINRVQIFAQVVEQGSFTAAAKLLGITKSTVSRKIADLEADTGVQLLFRTTRALKLTEAGASYYNRISKILLDLSQAEEQLSASQEVIKGNLKIVCPIELGQLFLAGIFAQFLSTYPEITIEAELSNRKVNVIEEGIDILFHIGDNPDPRLQSYALVNTHKTLMASPAYLAEHGTPLTPHDLKEHRAIRLQSAHIDGVWEIFDGQQWLEINPNAQLSVNNVTLAREAAIAGVGITAIPTFIAKDALQQKKLLPLLQDYSMRQGKLTLSYPQRAYLPRKYRVFIEFLYQAQFDFWGEQLLEQPDFIAQP